MLHYRQIVQRRSDDEIFHDETGYWMWDPKTETVMHSLVIPRAVCVLAGGRHTGATDAAGRLIIAVSAAADDLQWTIIQSPFMQAHARTVAFRHKIIVGDGDLSYEETTRIAIYGKTFDHTDQNRLSLQ